MTLFLRLSACLLTVAALAACNKSGPAAPAATTDAPPPAASASRTPATQATQATATPAADDDVHVTLDMDKVKTWMQAQKNLAHAVEADPSIGDPAQNVSEENTTQYAARLAASPKMRAAIEAAGVSTRDFAHIGDTLIGALMTEGALKGGQLKTVPDGIDPAAVEFVKQHEAEINAMMASMGAG